jgi:hypothetical protein
MNGRLSSTFWRFGTPTTSCTTKSGVIRTEFTPNLARISIFIAMIVVDKLARITLPKMNWGPFVYLASRVQGFSPEPALFLSPAKQVEPPYIHLGATDRFAIHGYDK